MCTGALWTISSVPIGHVTTPLVCPLLLDASPHLDAESIEVGTNRLPVAHAHAHAHARAHADGGRKQEAAGGYISS